MKYEYYDPNAVNIPNHSYYPNNNIYAAPPSFYPHFSAPEMHYGAMPPFQHNPHEMHMAFQPAIPVTLMPITQPPQPLPQPIFDFYNKQQSITELERYLVFFLSNVPPELPTYNNINNTLDQITLTDNQGIGITASVSKDGIKILFLEPNGTTSSPNGDHYTNKGQKQRIQNHATYYFNAIKALNFTNPIITPYIQNRTIGKNNIHFTYNNPYTNERFRAEISLDSGITIHLKGCIKIPLPAHTMNPEFPAMVAQSIQEADDAIKTFRDFLLSCDNNPYTPPRVLTTNFASLTHKKNQTVRFSLHNNNSIKLELVNQEKTYTIAAEDFIGPKESNEMVVRMKFLLEKKTMLRPNVHIPENYLSSHSWVAQTTRSSFSQTR